MNNLQLYFAIGVPTFAVLVGIVVGFFQNSHNTNQLGLRFTSLEGSMNQRIGLLEGTVNQRIGVLEQDMKTLVRVTNDLDVRLGRLEERLAR
jgi:hypothetical protein